MKTYDPKQVIVTFGARQLTGFADGTQIIVRPNEDAWALTVGNDGEGTRSKSNNNSGQIEVSLMQSSDDNAYLSAIYNADKLNNSGVNPAGVKDINGSSLYFAAQAYLKRLPDSEFARVAGARTWIIETDNLQAFVGGNS